MTPRMMVDALAEAAESRIRSGSFGIVGGVATPVGLRLFDVDRAAVGGQPAVAAAWVRVRELLSETGSTVGGVAVDLALVDEEADQADGDAYEVQAEALDGDALACVVPYRVRRFRGLQTAGRMYGEPDRVWLRHGG